MNMMTMKKLWRQYKYIVFIVAFVVYVFFFREKSDMMSVKKYDVLVSIIIFAYVSSVGFMDMLKRHSYQLQGPAFHTSLGDVPVKIKDSEVDYYLFRAGGFNHMMMSSKGDDGVVVIPKNYVSEQSGEFAFFSFPEEVELCELPITVQKYIESNKIPDPYYFCLLPSYLAWCDRQPTEASLVDYAQIIRNKNRQISELQAILAGKMDVIKDWNGVASNTAQSFNKPTQLSFKERLVGKVEP